MKKFKKILQTLVIHEVGILFRGAPIVWKKFYENHEEDLKFILRSSVFTGLLHCIEEAMSPIEYIEGNKYIFVFHRGIMDSSDLSEKEPIIAYAVLNKQNIEKTERIIEKKLKPLLKKALFQFIEENNGKEFIEITQFEYFQQTIDKIFHTDYIITSDK